VYVQVCPRGKWTEQEELGKPQEYEKARYVDARCSLGGQGFYFDDGWDRDQNLSSNRQVHYSVDYWGGPDHQYNDSRSLEEVSKANS
jgi:hypothetical protein